MADRWVGARAVVTAAFKADPWRSSAVTLLRIVQGVATPGYAVGLGILTEAVVQADRERAVMGLAIFVGLFIVQSWGSALRFPLDMQVRERTTHYIDEELVRLTATTPTLEHFERADYADKLQLLHQQRSALASAPSAVIWLANGVIQLITTVAILGRLDAPLLLLPLCGIPSAVISHRTSTSLEKLREDLAERGRIRRHLFQMATEAAPAKEIRVFGLQDEVIDHRDRIWKSMETDTLRVTIRYQLVAAIGWSVFAAGYVAALLLMVNRASRGQATVGDVVVTVSLGAQVRGRVQQLTSMWQWLIESLKSADRYAWLMAHHRTAVAATHPPEPKAVPERLTDGIRLEAVSFVYPGTDKPVLTTTDLHIPAGSIVAIVGDNGAGKSTLVKLLARYYDPTEGQITVDGVDLRDFDVDHWRHVLSAGFQDYAKFELMAAETVGIGDLSEADSPGAVDSALSRAAADGVLGELPAGGETLLGRSFEGGVELSGGQWQKLAIGRAMMRTEPLVLLLDEPTAALDPQTEHELFERYAAAARDAGVGRGAITLLVSHRFSTVRMADLIVVIADNGIAEVGTHAELVAQGGTYAELFELQAASYR
ncbi:MAG: ABC transporter ATP-binding protein [Acidimicrobiales bacterium]